LKACCGYAIGRRVAEAEMARHALLIGVSDFEDKRLQRLNAPASDVEALGKLLKDPRRGGFDKVATSLHGDFLGVRDELNAFYHANDPDDLLLFYYSGHGILSKHGRLFFATGSSNIDYPLSRSIPSIELRELLETSRAQRQIVILDCCHSGAFTEGKKGQRILALTQETFHNGEPGRYVLAAADALQPAFDGAELKVGEQPAASQLSQFTSWLVDGIAKGEAAPDDNEITMDALFKYLRRKARDLGSVMVPQRFISHSAGDLVISRNPTPSTAAIGADLRTALQSESWIERLGAVAELAKAVREGTRAQAAGAYRLLEERRSAEFDTRVLAALNIVEPRSTSLIGNAELHEQRQPLAQTEKVSTSLRVAELNQVNRGLDGAPHDISELAQPYLVAGIVDRNSEEKLELDQIQGDILTGLQKNSQLFVAFSVENVSRFKRFLRGLYITTARDALQTDDRIAAFRNNGGKGLLDIRGVNIGFTAGGLRKLGTAGLELIRDTSFSMGMLARSTALGDPSTGPGAPQNWVVGNDTDELHGLLIITGRDRQSVSSIFQDLEMAAGSGAWKPFYVECANVRPESQRGREHFGFLDGISQPAVRGQISDFFPTRQFLNPSLNSSDPNQGLPGTDLLWPGEFVFGYSSQIPSDFQTPGPLMDGGLPWMKNGSFMVWRRLEQLVPEFHAAVKNLSTRVGQTATVVAARMVGRFPSGAPVVLTPWVDDPTLGADRARNNSFEFGEDPVGLKCPFYAHIRKSYPRNDITPAAGGGSGQSAEDMSESNTQSHRILRRSISFGDELEEGERTSGRTTVTRGLMFVCYQTSIQDQFEFITQNWINNPNFSVSGSGIDPIVGQQKGAYPLRLLDRSQPSEGVVLEEDFVRPTGGGYFFMPSINAIQSVLAKSWRI
jgi:Dyp-type peroxidase family